MVAQMGMYSARITFLYKNGVDVHVRIRVKTVCATVVTMNAVFPAHVNTHNKDFSQLVLCWCPQTLVFLLREAVGSKPKRQAFAAIFIRKE
jgi:hypothetical protein